MTLQKFPLIFFFFFLCIAKPVFLLFIGVDGRNPRRTLDIIYIEILECYKKMWLFIFSLIICCWRESGIVVFWYNNRLFSYDDVLLELINRPSFAWRGNVAMWDAGQLFRCLNDNEKMIVKFSIDKMESRSIEFIDLKWWKHLVCLLQKPAMGTFSRMICPSGCGYTFSVGLFSSRLCNLRLLFSKKKKKIKNRGGGGERIYNTPNLYSAH